MSKASGRRRLQDHRRRRGEEGVDAPAVGRVVVVGAGVVVQVQGDGAAGVASVGVLGVFVAAAAASCTLVEPHLQAVQGALHLCHRWHRRQHQVSP
jgi:hypothetical protein